MRCSREAQNIAVDLAEWMAANIRIIDKQSRLLQLVLNPDQQRLCELMAEQHLRGFPARILVLKSRKIGFSTLTEARFFTDCLMRPRRRAFVAAHTSDSTANIFNMTQLMLRELPDMVRKPVERSSRREIVWSGPHDSKIEVATAGGQDIGRGDTVDMLHGSEVAFWPTAKSTLLGLLNSMGDHSDTEVVLETTANGVGGEFYDRYVSAVERLHKKPEDFSGYLPVFFPWTEFAEYRVQLTAGYSMGQLDDEETALKSLGVDDGQLLWRRSTIEGKCGGDLSLFKQEYPSNWQEAFQFSGRPVFPAAIIAYHSGGVKDAIRRVRLLESGSGEVFAQDYDGNGPCWEIWQEPQFLRDYSIGADVAEGKLSDPLDENSKADDSAASVMDRHDLTQVAEFCGRIDPDLFGVELLKAARWYHNAWVTPEINSAGFAALAKLREYPHLYRRDGQYDRLSPQPLATYGWKTTVSNRDWLIDQYIAGCRADSHGYTEGDYVSIRSRRLLGEEQTFVVDTHGKRQHRPGGHDDRLFASMIAYEVHLRCPRGQTTAAEPPKTPRGNMKYAGGYDDRSDLA